MATARIGYKRYQGYVQIYICKGCYSCSHTFRYIVIIKFHVRTIRSRRLATFDPKLISDRCPVSVCDSHRENINHKQIIYIWHVCNYSSLGIRQRSI